MFRTAVRRFQMRNTWKFCLLFGTAFLMAGILLAGCRRGGPTVVPMRTIAIDLSHQTQPPCLIAMFPGLSDEPEQFQQEGWPQLLADSDVRADVLLVDAHIGYVREDMIRARVREDVIQRAIAEGYEQLWFVGVSMGGGISLSIAASETDDIAGLILFAPYPGPRPLLTEIAEAGGPKQWSPNFSSENPEYRADGGPTFRAVWAWLRTHQYTNGSLLPIYLHYGTNDRAARGFELIAETLDEEHVRVESGGHGWETWNPMWTHFVQSGVLQQACGTLAAGDAS